MRKKQEIEHYKKREICPTCGFGRNVIRYKGELARDASLRLTDKRNASLVANRLRAGWDIERAYTEPVLLPKISYKGETTSSASFRMGYCKNIVFRRLKDGWPIEKAFTEEEDHVYGYKRPFKEWRERNRNN